ncbi:MAG: MoaD/ThiS family protein [Aquabacterium sp.]|jgi:sulfur carrier protein|nr:MoaD/ThiS family protein [Aquabacterium sp.]
MTMPETITIHTDRGPLLLPKLCNLEAAVDLLLHGSDKDESCVATAVNGQFVARTDRASHILADGDTVLCFSPITGG